MPSPFPGMNPYLEQDDAWHDFHERFIAGRVGRSIGAQVRPVTMREDVNEHFFDS